MYPRALLKCKLACLNLYHVKLLNWAKLSGNTPSAVPIMPFLPTTCPLAYYFVPGTKFQTCRNATAVCSPSKCSIPFYRYKLTTTESRKHLWDISSNFHRTKLSHKETGLHYMLLEGTKAIRLQLYLTVKFQGQVHPKEQIPSLEEEKLWTKLWKTTSKSKNWACPGGYILPLGSNTNAISVENLGSC